MKEKITDAKVSEFIIQIAQMTDGVWSGLAVLTNYGNIYRYDRFGNWSKITPIEFTDNN